MLTVLTRLFAKPKDRLAEIAKSPGFSAMADSLLAKDWATGMAQRAAAIAELASLEEWHGQQREALRQEREAAARIVERAERVLAAARRRAADVEARAADVAAEHSRRELLAYGVLGENNLPLDAARKELAKIEKQTEAELRIWREKTQNYRTGNFAYRDRSNYHNEILPIIEGCRAARAELERLAVEFVGSQRDFQQKLEAIFSTIPGVRVDGDVVHVGKRR